MKSSKVGSQVHKCFSRNNNPSVASFCAYCGKFMSQSGGGCSFYRSDKYNLVDPYRLDGNVILSEMIKKQNNNRSYNPQAQFIKYRSELLGFVKYIQSRLEYSDRTYYLGISILDNLLSQYSVEKQHLKLACFMALHVAAKMEEKTEKIPELEIVVKLFEDRFELQDLKDWELTMIKSAGYNCNIRTPYTFVEHFLSRGVVGGDDLGSKEEQAIEKEVTKFEGVVMNFLKISSKNYDFYRFSPVTVAAATIACSRKVMGFKICWNRDLEQLTTLRCGDIEVCAKMLYKVYKGVDSSSMVIDDAEAVGRTTKTSLKSNNSDRNIRSQAKMAAEPSNHKSGGIKTDFMLLDTDEDEPAKNHTTYRSQRNA